MILLAGRGRARLPQAPRRPARLVICLAAMVAAAGATGRPVPRRPTRARRRRSCASFPAYLLLVGAYGGASSSSTQRDYVSPDLSLGGVLETVYGGLLGFSGPYTYETRFLTSSSSRRCSCSGSSGWPSCCTSRCGRRRRRTRSRSEERDRARELVRRYGSDTLAYFALRLGQALLLRLRRRGDDRVRLRERPRARRRGPDRRAAVGRPRLAEFMDFCHARAWRVAFLAIRDDALPKYRALGLRGIYLGDEAIILVPGVHARRARR